MRKSACRPEPALEERDPVRDPSRVEAAKILLRRMEKRGERFVLLAKARKVLAIDRGRREEGRHRFELREQRRAIETGLAKPRARIDVGRIGGPLRVVLERRQRI